MKILIADDEIVSRRMLQALLTKWDFEVIAAENGRVAWEILQHSDAPRLALLDWMMPEMNGVDVCRRVRTSRTEPYTYMLLVTAKDAKESIVEGLESGADDYLIKPFNAQELKARLRVGVRVLNLEDSLVQAREAMRFKATHDALTGLWNRGAILEAMDREINRSRRENLSLGVLIVDLDHFKSVNDTYGHPCGDAVLREIARRFHAGVRSYDSAGRYGGEEFLLLLPGCDGPEAWNKAEQLRLAVSREAIETPSASLRVTVSIGAFATAVCPSCTAREILSIADAALYRAKQQGRNRVFLAGAEDREPQHASLQTVTHVPSQK